MHGCETATHCPCFDRSLRWLPVIGFALLVYGLLAGAITLHTMVAQDPAVPGNTPDAPTAPAREVPLNRIVIPAPLDDTGAGIVIRSIETLPADAQVLLDFNATAGSVRAAAKLAHFVFADPTRHYTALVTGRVADATLLPVTACHDIWMWPGSQLGPFTLSGDRAFEQEYGAYRSRLRSVSDSRASRAGLWEKWRTPDLPLYVQPGPPMRFTTSTDDLTAAKLVQDAGLLVMVGADAAQFGLARLISGSDLRVWARGHNLRLVEATLRPDAEALKTAPPKPDTPHRPALPTTPQTGVIIPIAGPIDGTMFEHIQRRSNEAIANGATVIVFEIDTPGGLISSMIEIMKAIDAIRGKVLTVAWVKVEAISAGAMIALSCDYIAMRDGTRIGDCQPIMTSDAGYTVAGEKIQTYLRSLVSNQAERNGYPKALAQAMITQELEVIRVRPINESDVVLLLDTFGSEFVIRRDFDAWEHRARFEVVEIIVHGAKSSDAVSTGGSGGPGGSGPGDSDGDLLTLTDRQARQYGFALENIHTWDDLEATFHIGSTHGTGAVNRLDVTWSVDLVRWINALAVVWIMLGLLGIYIEMKTPGVGIGGVIAVISFGIYFTSGIWIGLAETWEILVFIAGVLLILAEIFIIPGFGVAGITGLILTVVGLLLIGQDFILPSTPGQSADLVRNLGGLVLSLMGTCIGIYIFARAMPGLPIFGGMLLKNPTEEEAAGLHGSAVSIEPGTMIGAIGFTTSVCRPSGKARFGDRVLVVQTRGQYLEPDTEVVIIESSANRIVVKPLHAESPAGHQTATT